ncbi:MAG: hypothetical protein AB8B45_03500, partial [Prochlorococcus sp.]
SLVPAKPAESTHLTLPREGVKLSINNYRSKIIGSLISSLSAGYSANNKDMRPLRIEVRPTTLP